MKITKIDFIKFFNEEQDKRLNGLKMFLNSDIENYFDNSNQPTQDQTKLFSYMINDIIYDYFKSRKGISIKEEENGYDLNYNSNLIESKITKANDKGVIKMWTGNKSSSKVPLHLLIGYTFNNERINGLFVSIIDTSKTQGWSSSDFSSSSFSNLQFTELEAKCMHILIGKRNINKRIDAYYEQFLVEKLF